MNIFGLFKKNTFENLPNHELLSENRLDLLCEGGPRKKVLSLALIHYLNHLFYCIDSKYW